MEAVNHLTQEHIIIHKLLNCSEENYFDCSRKYCLKRLNGITNTVYLVEVDKIEKSDINDEETIQQDKNNFFTNPNDFKFILRIYGELGKNADRNLENQIIHYLSKKNLVAKIITVGDIYRIEEYLEGYEDSTKEELLMNIETIIDILIEFNFQKYYKFQKEVKTEEDDEKINQNESKFIKFKIDNNSHNSLNDKVNKVDQTSPNHLIQEKNKILEYIDNVIINSYNKEQIKLNSRIQYDKKNSEELNIINMHFNQRVKEILRIKDMIQKLDSIVEQIVPLNGVLVMTHNDVHKGNIMMKTSLRARELDENFIKLMDFEYSKLSLLGYDFINLNMEFCFDYVTTPFTFYEFDYEGSYNYFKIYAERFINKLNKENGESYIDESLAIFLKSEEYFRSLCKLCCIFWISGMTVVDKCIEINDESLELLIEKAKLNKIENKTNMTKENNLFSMESFDYVHYLGLKFDLLDSLLMV